MKKAMKMFLIVLLIVLIAIGVRLDNVARRKNKWPSEMGEVVTVQELGLTFRIVSNDDSNEEIQEGFRMVKTWWNNDKTFNMPQTAWIYILEGNTILGIENNSTIYIRCNQLVGDRLLATVINTTLHAQNENSLQDCFGLKEMIVECITYTIMEEQTDLERDMNYLEVMKASDLLWNNRERLMDLYREIPNMQVKDISKVTGWKRESLYALDSLLEGKELSSNEIVLIGETFGIVSN